MEKSLCTLCRREFEPKVIQTFRSVFGEPVQEIETISGICKDCLGDMGDEGEDLSEEEQIRQEKESHTHD